jgi:hypothetical protein
MNIKSLFPTLALALGTTIVASNLQAAEPKVKYTLESAGNDINATGKVEIKGKKLKVELKDAHPNTLYTVWIDFRNRAAGGATPPGFPVGAAQGVAPAFGAYDPVYNGMRPDLNGIFTDDKGKGKLNINLDYNLLDENASPVVGVELSMQGLNRVGGYWLRLYPTDPNTAATNQIVDTEGRPLVVRSTAQGITIVRHPDNTTHGHTPGVKNVDHLSAFKGDFPAPSGGSGSSGSSGKSGGSGK